MQNAIVRKIGLALLMIAVAVGVAFAVAEAVRQVAGFSAWPMYLIYIIALPLIGALVCGLPLAYLNHRLTRERNEFNRLLSTDPITGLASRRAFFASAAQMIADVSAANLPITLMFVQADHFQTTRKQHGDEAADQLLRLVAAHLDEVAAEVNLPQVLTVRLGRDAFAMLLVGADPSIATKAAERLCDLVGASSTVAGGVEIDTTVSVGVTLRRGEEDIDVLLGAAEAAAAQVAGKPGNNWVFAGAPRVVKPSRPTVVRVA